MCPLCNVDVEHLLHVFFDCRFASECWSKAGLVYDMQRVEEAPPWLLDRIKNENAETCELIAKVLWGIWFARNQKVWEGKNITPSVTLEISTKQIKEWQEAKKRKYVLNTVTRRDDMQEDMKWSPPSRGCFKLNVDASVVMGDSSYAVGMVIRDDRGRFVQGKNMRFLGMVTVLEAEARGV